MSVDGACAAGTRAQCACASGGGHCRGVCHKRRRQGRRHPRPGGHRKRLLSSRRWPRGSPWGPPRVSAATAPRPARRCSSFGDHLGLLVGRHAALATAHSPRVRVNGSTFPAASYVRCRRLSAPGGGVTGGGGGYHPDGRRPDAPRRVQGGLCGATKDPPTRWGTTDGAVCVVAGAASVARAPWTTTTAGAVGAWRVGPRSGRVGRRRQTAAGAPAAVTRARGADAETAPAVAWTVARTARRRRSVACTQSRSAPCRCAWLHRFPVGRARPVGRWAWWSVRGKR